jgi:hypothetical protein
MGNKQRREWFPSSTEADEACHRPNHRNFKESGSADQNVARRKHPPKEVVSRNFRPLRPTDVVTDSSGTETISNEEAVPGKTGRPPPIILTSAAILIQLQKQLKSVVKENFEFLSTRK